jgi:hypothetical protein
LNNSGTRAGSRRGCIILMVGEVEGDGANRRG